MKCSVFSRPGGRLLWCGDLACIPRVGEPVEVVDGWASLWVRGVTYRLPSAEVIIDVDGGDDYPLPKEAD